MTVHLIIYEEPHFMLDDDYMSIQGICNQLCPITKNSGNQDIKYLWSNDLLTHDVAASLIELSGDDAKINRISRYQREDTYFNDLKGTYTPFDLWVKKQPAPYLYIKLIGEPWMLPKRKSMVDLLLGEDK